LGVKFHDLQVPRTSRFFRRALEGEVILLSRRAYLEALADAIEALPPSVAIMRLAAEIPDGERAMPRELFEKAALKRDLIALMGARGSRQGSSRGVAPGR
jgi:radical SAM superfamily enzyme